MVDMCYLRVFIAARLGTSWIIRDGGQLNRYVCESALINLENLILRYNQDLPLFLLPFNLPGVISMPSTSTSMSKSTLHIAPSVSCDVWHEPFANVCIVLPPVVD